MNTGPATSREQRPYESDNRQLLQSFCDNGFDGSVGACAIVLGRTPDEIAGMLNDSETIDEDLVMKIQGIARERGINIQHN
jgi:hypothetical protein